MNIDKKYQIITRNLEEALIDKNKIKNIMDERPLNIYWGTAPTGRIHIGYFVPILKIVDLLITDCNVTVLLADIHAFIDNNKSELNVLEARTAYYQLMIETVINNLYHGNNKVKFIKGSDYQLKKQYMLDMLRFNSLITVNQAKHAGAEVVKYSNNPVLTGLLYPSLQALDEKYLEADCELGGVDQRKLFVFSKDNMYKMGYERISYLMTPIVSGISKNDPELINIIFQYTLDPIPDQTVQVFLRGSFDNWKESYKMECRTKKFHYEYRMELKQSTYEFKFMVKTDKHIFWDVDKNSETVIDKDGNINNKITIIEEKKKMSASDSNSKIDMLESKTQIRKKINRAFCLPGKISNNVLFEILEHIIFPILKIKNINFKINRKKKFGGPITYSSYKILLEEYKIKKLYPGDLKLGIIDNLNLILMPIRQKFKEYEKIIKSAYESKK